MAARISQMICSRLKRMWRRAPLGDIAAMVAIFAYSSSVTMAAAFRAAYPSSIPIAYSPLV